MFEASLSEEVDEGVEIIDVGLSIEGENLVSLNIDIQIWTCQYAPTSGKLHPSGASGARHARCCQTSIFGDNDGRDAIRVSCPRSRFWHQKMVPWHKSQRCVYSLNNYGAQAWLRLGEVPHQTRGWLTMLPVYNGGNMKDRVGYWYLRVVEGGWSRIRLMMSQPLAGQC